MRARSVCRVMSFGGWLWLLVTVGGLQAWAQESRPTSRPQSIRAVRTPQHTGRLSAQQLVRVRWAVKEFAKTLNSPPRTASFPCEPVCRYESRVVWRTKLPEVGESSPRAIDLNGDGVLDIVVGSGVFGIGGGKTGMVYAVNGRDGQLLWKYQLPGDVYATPTFLDINKDGVPDVVMAGRFNSVYALHGRTGQLLWELKSRNPHVPIPKANFNTSVLVGDLDGDGVQDLLTVQGGEVIDEGITVGRLYQISGRTGRILKSVEVPDRREIYSTPAYLSGKKHALLYIGTGGERIPGHMMALDFPGLREVWRYPSYQKGYIASPLVYQFAGRPYPDVVNAGFDGRLVRLDGRTGKKLWEHAIPDHETYTSPALGRFSDPKRRDVFVAYYQGVWPRYQRSQLLWVHGNSGKLLAKRPFGTYSLSSPLVADLNGDGFDEVIVSTNDVDQAKMRKLDKLVNIIRPALGNPSQLQEALLNPEKRPEFLPKDLPTYTSPYFSMKNTIVILDGKTRKIHWSQSFVKHSYSSSTPLLQDIDHNGKIDLVYAYLGYLVRFEFKQAVPRSALHWNQFRGASGDGVLRTTDVSQQIPQKRE